MAIEQKKNMGRSPQLREANMQLADQAFRKWVVKAPHGVSMEVMLEPRYWASVARNLLPWDEIIVHAEDCSYYGKLLVMAVEPFAVQVGQLEYFEMDKLKTKTVNRELATEVHDYTVQFDSKSKWKAVRNIDKVVVLQGYSEKEKAQEALVEYLNRLKKID